jgi:pilus assembly protein FimV
MIRADTLGRRFVMLRRAVGHPSLGGAAALGFVLSASWSDPMLAIGLGPVTQQSALGQSLRIVVPVIVSPGEDIAAECFRLGASDREVDGVPQLAFGRTSLERTSAGAQIVITNARPVNDPVLRVTVQAGCESPVRREYVLLMDPPPIETPLVAAESEARTNVAQAPPPPAATPARSARGGERAGNGGVTRGAPGEAVRAARKAPPPKARPPAKAAPKRPVRAAAEQPRLTVSSAAPLIAVDPRAPNTSDAEQIRAQQELANAIEAETVVLRQRIVELTAMVEQMQEQVRANELAQRAPAEAAKAAPVAKPTAWWEDNWPLLSAIIGLPLVLAAALLLRRRQQREQVTDWQAAGVASLPTESAPAVPDPGLQNAPAGIAAPMPKVEPPPRKVPRRTPIARDGASALAVSELLHVTEEARVYVALGHPERAIDVLNEHIRQVPRSMPAAWLMLLDLYHASGRRQDFRRLAEEFHLHCNVQAPLWEGFRASESDEGGLETFPHILRQVASIWREPSCREYLEGLLYDNREGRRMGFPLAAYGDILLLLQILDAPPIVDIDSDLVVDGRLEPIPQRTAAIVSSNNPPKPSPATHAGPTDAAARPSQRPLDLGADVDEPERERAKKLSS